MFMYMYALIYIKVSIFVYKCLPIHINILKNHFSCMIQKIILKNALPKAYIFKFKLLFQLNWKQ